MTLTDEPRMHIVHLTASTFFGGPERQMLGLAQALPAEYRTTFLSFAENGKARDFLDRVATAGFQADALRHDTPHLRSALRELTARLRELHADILVCHAYKSNILGRLAARRVGIPVLAVSRGWTQESFKVRLYEKLDRWHLRFMDRVVAVSDGQAEKVRHCGVKPDRLLVIRNAARLEAFRDPDPADRQRLRDLFPNCTSDQPIICAAGRLSPEKGFDILIQAAGLVRDAGVDVRLAIFGEGGERASLEAKIRSLQLTDRVILSGFRTDLDRLIPWADVMVLSSYTEGLPNVALEASAAGVPVVATAVGGNPEVVRDSQTGFLVPAGDPLALAERIRMFLEDAELRQRMAQAAKALMEAEFSFGAQASAYHRLFTELASTSGRVKCSASTLSSIA